MATSNINRVVLTGNLTRDPVLRDTSSGTPVCGLRIASNTRRKTSGGEWADKPNYFSVTVWGAQGENCHRFLSKGRAVAIDGRLEWREWTHEDSKREAVEIVADAVQFLTNPNGNTNRAGAGAPAAADEDDTPFKTPLPGGPPRDGGPPPGAPMRTQDRAEHSLGLAALRYASWGWKILPLHTPTDGVCSCGEP